MSDATLPVAAATWQIAHAQGTLTWTLLTPEIVRVAFTPLDAPAHRTWSVLPGSDARRTTDYAVVPTQQGVQVRTTALTLTLDHQNGSFSVGDAAGTPLCDTVRLASGTERTWTMRLAEDAAFLGGGERTGSLNRRGRTLTFWVQDALPNYDAHTDAMYQAIPFLLHLTGGRVGGIFFDSSWRAQADIGQTVADTFSYQTTGPDLVAYICAGPTMTDALRQYASITGLMPPLPRWALGYQQSRWNYGSDAEVRAIAARFRAEEIPCDAIHLDIGYMDGYRSFTWDRDRFPDPSGLVADLRAQGFEVVTVIDPGLKVDPAYTVYAEARERGYLIRDADAQPFEGWVWPGRSVWPDFARDEVRAWWGTQHRGLVEAGVAGIWIDMNEPTQADMWAPPDVTIPHGTSLPLTAQHGPESAPITHAEFHNAYGLAMAQTTRAALEHLRPDQRPFVLTRAAFAGSQRYAIAWNGDTTSSWEHLRLTIPLNLGMGLSGMPVTGCDIGGFWEDTTPELLVRFTQLGALLPFCRNHSALDTVHQEPWSFGEPHTSLCRSAIGWRYRLLPYLISLAHAASTLGLPVMRPLCWLDPTDATLVACDHQFLLGDAVLVAPVLTEGATHHQVQLPPGEWFDMENDEVHSGPTIADFSVTLASMPLFARSGTIIPQAAILSSTGEIPREPLTLHVYLTHPGQVATLTWWDDDDTPDTLQEKRFMQYQITATWQGAEIVVRGEHLDGQMPWRYPGMRIQLHLPAHVAPQLPLFTNANGPFTLHWHAL